MNYWQFDCFMILIDTSKRQSLNNLISSLDYAVEHWSPRWDHCAHICTQCRIEEILGQYMRAVVYW